MEREFEELNNIDRDTLIEKMTAEIRTLGEMFGLSDVDIAEKSGMDERQLSAVIKGETKMKWSEYLALLFLFWRNEKSRKVIEEKGLFPVELKRAMSVNRTLHEVNTQPVYQSGRTVK